MRHQLKTWPPFFQAVADGRKRFELRKNDRDFVVGDVLDLCEWDPETGEYTGERCSARVLYLSKLEAIPELSLGDRVCLSIELIENPL